MTNPKPKEDEILGPAVETSLHVWNRPATDEDMRPITGTVACTKLSKVENVYRRKQLEGGNPKYNADLRFQVAGQFALLFDLWRPGTTDSTQKLNVSRSTGGGSGRDAAIDAGNRIAAIRKHLGDRDRKILDLVFEDGEWPAIAVREVTGDYEDSRPARFREALDALLEAWESVRKQGWRRVAGGVRM